METLKAVKENNILKMYVDEAVLKFMGSREYESSLLANEILDATVAFIDICSFTPALANGNRSLPPFGVLHQQTYTLGQADMVGEIRIRWVTCAGLHVRALVGEEHQQGRCEQW